MTERPLARVRPSLDELLPDAALRSTYDQIAAGLEAGRLVRAARKRAGLSQQMLAARLEITQARVSAIEAGRGRDGPSYGLLKRVAAACGTSIVSFLELAGSLTEASSSAGLDGRSTKTGASARAAASRSASPRRHGG
jgi:transcriptional regulator with XRE-family HTH domain